MPMPKPQNITLPLLGFASDGKEHSLREAIDNLADAFDLPANERNELLPSGQRAVFDNRVGWACAYLKQSGILQSTRRGYFCITQRGRDVLQENPPEINMKFLEQFPEFKEFRSRSRKDQTSQPGADSIEFGAQTPNEAIEDAYQKMRGDLAQDLLARVMGCSPAFFERIVVQLLVRMGYGGSLKDAGNAVGQSGDEGIDGIIKEDRLGLEIVYIQAKRWQQPVGRPEVQKFVGALQGQRARKGVFITTSSFSNEARDYASRIDNKVVLIDGAELAHFMIDFDLGVSRIAAYEIKRIDSDFFSEE